MSVAGGRRAIEGRFLEAGHLVHDAYVGKPQPVAAARNPVTYFDSPHATRTCGCGAPVTVGWFLTGHDQKALHDRVAKIGTVHQFIEWFDRTYAEEEQATRFHRRPLAEGKDQRPQHSWARWSVEQADVVPSP
ncbi:hypothetical protein [Streptomyces kaempferi]|uniref:Uncharacterized protein n=1 Tax=Streptomyces kaempferi TaxID=333725 RepID=A0ABW3XRE2_9ACTN